MDRPTATRPSSKNSAKGGARQTTHKGCDDSQASIGFGRRVSRLAWGSDDTGMCSWGLAAEALKKDDPDELQKPNGGGEVLETHGRPHCS